uniref:Uncharacterized protein n=1 Tax=Lepeophtheirus salmonis TaxID=72036 RepID=A0A0K2VD31_LEPSM
MLFGHVFGVFYGKFVKAHTDPFKSPLAYRSRTIAHND